MERDNHLVSTMRLKYTIRMKNYFSLREKKFNKLKEYVVKYVLIVCYNYLNYRKNRNLSTLPTKTFILSEFQCFKMKENSE